MFSLHVCLRYDTGGMELLRKYEASSDALPVTESLELLHHVDLEAALLPKKKRN
jgi:hypothetical protein